MYISDLELRMLTDLIHRTLEIDNCDRAALGALVSNRLTVVMQLWEKPARCYAGGS